MIKKQRSRGLLDFCLMCKCFFRRILGRKPKIDFFCSIFHTLPYSILFWNVSYSYVHAIGCLFLLICVLIVKRYISTICKIYVLKLLYLTKLRILFLIMNHYLYRWRLFIESQSQQDERKTRCQWKSMYINGVILAWLVEKFWNLKF